VAFVSRRISMVRGFKRTVAKAELGILGDRFPGCFLSLIPGLGNGTGPIGIDLSSDAFHTALVEYP
jgi:hypothetical protein